MNLAAGQFLQMVFVQKVMQARFACSNSRYDVGSKGGVRVGYNFGWVLLWVGFESVASAQKSHNDNLRVSNISDLYRQWALESMTRIIFLTLVASHRVVGWIGHCVSNQWFDLWVLLRKCFACVSAVV